MFQPNLKAIDFQAEQKRSIEAEKQRSDTLIRSMNWILHFAFYNLHIVGIEQNWIVTEICPDCEFRLVTIHSFIDDRAAQSFITHTRWQSRRNQNQKLHSCYDCRFLSKFLSSNGWANLRQAELVTRIDYSHLLVDHFPVYCPIWITLSCVDKT